jgi:DNA-binding response OmpR family regulator
MRILIVDDEPNIRQSLRTALEARKNTVEEAPGVAGATGPWL